MINLKLYNTFKIKISINDTTLNKVKFKKSRDIFNDFFCAWTLCIYECC